MDCDHESCSAAAARTLLLYFLADINPCRRYGVDRIGPGNEMSAAWWENMRKHGLRA
jgi:hypothetical protein